VECVSDMLVYMLDHCDNEGFVAMQKGDLVDAERAFFAETLQVADVIALKHKHAVFTDWGKPITRTWKVLQDPVLILNAGRGAPVEELTIWELTISLRKAGWRYQFVHKRSAGQTYIPVASKIW